MKTVGVIGSGIGGLAVACRLKAKGYDVTVFEAQDKIGGKVQSIEQGEYRFDMGPSLFTMPSILKELFEDCGKNFDDYFSFSEVPESCHYFFSDGSDIQFFKNKKKLAKELDEAKLDKRQVFSYLDKSSKLYDDTGDIFLNKPLHKVKTYLNSTVLSLPFTLWKYPLWNSLNGYNRRRFDDKRLIQLFDRFSTYNGSDPRKTPAMLSMIPHFEHNIGTFLPKGGMYGINQAVQKLAKDLGVKFKLSSKVDEIIADKNTNTVLGLKSKGAIHVFDKVISNMDIYFTYKNLLKNERMMAKQEKQERSLSALIFYVGIKKEFKKLGLHNIFFADDYDKEFDTLFTEKKVYEDPTIYVNITSKYEENDAPKGKENWFVMVNAPARSERLSEEEINQARERIFQKLSAVLGEDILELIEVEDTLTPEKIESRTLSYQGSLYGPSSNSRMSAFLRQRNESKEYDGLYFVGGSVHPGGGIPLCLSSAKIASNLLTNA